MEGKTPSFKCINVVIIAQSVQTENQYHLLNGDASTDVDLPEIVHHDDDDLLNIADDVEEEVNR